MLPSKANSRRLVHRPGKRGACGCSCHAHLSAGFICLECLKAHAPIAMVIKSEEALEFVETVKQAAVATSCHLLMIEGVLAIDVVVYQDSLRRDLDIELLCDALQAAKVLKNDRAIWQKRAWRRIDKESPRVEFSLRPADRAEELLAQADLFAQEEKVPF